MANFTVSDSKFVSDDGDAVVTVVSVDGNGNPLTSIEMLVQPYANNEYAQAHDFATQWLADNPTTPAAYVPPTLEQLKARAKLSVVDWVNNFLMKITTKYPNAEQQLWPTLETEAKAFDLDVISNNTLSDFSTLHNMLERKLGPAADETESLNRLADFIPGVLANAVAYREIATLTSGIRQNVELAIDAATDEEGIRNVLEAAKADVALLIANDPTLNAYLG